MKNYDVARMAELSMVRLLSARVLMTVRKVAGDGPVDERDRRRLNIAADYLNSVKDGLSLDVQSTHFLIAADDAETFQSALASSPRGDDSLPASRDDVSRIADFCLRLAQGSDLDANEMADIEGIFGMLAEYAGSQHRHSVVGEMVQE